MSEIVGNQDGGSLLALWRKYHQNLRGEWTFALTADPG